MKKQIGLVVAIVAVVTIAGSVPSRYKPTEPLDFVVDTLATGLIAPWEIAFLPGNTMLFTERSGKVRMYRGDRLLEKPVLQVTEVETNRKMGLLGLCLHPQFQRNRQLYLAYNYRNENNSLLKVVRYQMQGDTLVEPITLVEGIMANPNHTGCRLLFGPDENLYISTGDADRPILAQDLKSLNGKILRLKADGTIPADNPFYNSDTARHEIWSYGHRNPQGLAFRPGTKELYASEHGPTGGDEINRITKGSNYGWPLAHHTTNREGMVPPLIEYTPSIGPSQLLFYTGSAFPQLKDKLLLACLRGEKIMQFTLGEDGLTEEENIVEKTYGRLRALAQDSAGYLYTTTSEVDPPEGRTTAGYDLLLRLRPANVANAKPTSIKRKAAPAATVRRKQGSTVLYAQLCASCHGPNMEGNGQTTTNLSKGQWRYGHTRAAIVKNIRNGLVQKGMPAWEGSLTEEQMQGLATLLLQRTAARKKR